MTDDCVSDEDRHLTGNAEFVFAALGDVWGTASFESRGASDSKDVQLVVSTMTFAIGSAVKSTKRAKNTTAAFARSRITRWITSIAEWWKFLPEEISKPSANTLSLACTASLRTSR